MIRTDGLAYLAGDEEKKFYAIGTKKCKKPKVQNQKQTDRQRRYKQKE